MPTKGRNNEKQRKGSRFAKRRTRRGQCARQLRQAFGVVCATDDEEETPEDKSVNEKISSIFLDIDFLRKATDIRICARGLRL